MPNFTGNTVRIIGHEEDLDLFEAKKIAFSHFVPPPEGAEIDWYVEHWGTKWDPVGVSIKRDGENGITFNFETAWGPPIPFLKRLLEKFPRCWIKVNYGDAMTWGAGMWIGYMKKGEMIIQDLEWLEPLPILSKDGEVITSFAD